MTKEIMDAALTRAGLDPGDFHPWFEDWTDIDYRTFTVRIHDGVWDEMDFSDGAWDGGGSGDFTVDGSTLVVHDTEGQCDVPFKLNRFGDVLNVELGNDTCGDEDVLQETAIYEASPFHLLQAADWQPPEWSPPPPPSPRPTRGVSTSGERVTLQPTGAVEGAPLGYLEYLPPNYTETGDPSPLLLFLHGSGESGTGSVEDLGLLEQSGISYLVANDAWPDSRPFVVLAPQHDDQAPNYCLEATEIHDFIAFAQEHYNIDPIRIYATGLSCGAIGLWNYLTQYGAESLAAVIPIAGNGVLVYEVRGCELATLPIWAFHGQLDGSVPVFGDVYPLTQLQACTNPAPVDARLTVVPNAGHDVWSRTYGGADNYDIYSWLLSHTKP
jgi:poly(3-hydroxybutyrate) depolymerase